MNIFQINNLVAMYSRFPGATEAERLANFWNFSKKFSTWTTGEFRQVFGMVILNHNLIKVVEEELELWEAVKDGPDFQEVPEEIREGTAEYYEFLAKLLPIVRHMQPLFEQKNGNPDS
jgi:hypothetical protein